MSNMQDVINSINEMSFDELNSVYEALTSARSQAIKYYYDEMETEIKNIFKKYGEMGFGVCIKDNYGSKLILSSGELEDDKDGYYIIPFHILDDEQCDEYDIPESARE